MKEKKQKVGQIRKNEILDAAKKVFLRKGFADTVMEDIINETSLSRGGVYYHYKNKVEILHDLMREGIAYRIEKINEFLTEHSEGPDKNTIAQMITDKVLDENELMSVYAIYLQAQKSNKDLSDLFPILVEESLKAAYIGVKGSKKGNYIHGNSGYIIPSKTRTGRQRKIKLSKRFKSKKPNSPAPTVSFFFHTARKIKTRQRRRTTPRRI